MQRTHLVDAEAHGSYDTPTTGKDTQGDRCSAGQDNPKRHRKILDEAAQHIDAVAVQLLQWGMIVEQA